MRLPDGAASRALLIGTAGYEHLPKVPQSGNNLLALSTALMRHSGLPASSCRTVLDPPGLAEFGEAVTEAAAQADDLLLVYYSGHGVIGPDGRLHLTLPSTSPDRLPWSGVPFEFLHHALRNAAASTRVLILDCCYSGRAIGTLGDGGTVMGQIRIGGTYTLTSSPANEVSYAPEGRTHTAFTEALLDLLDAGSRDCGDLLTLHDLYLGLLRLARQRGLPLPQKQGTHTADQLALARNRYRAPGVGPEPVRITPEDEPATPAGNGGATTMEHVLTAADVQATRFRTVRLAEGYDMEDVDSFLTRAVAALADPVGGPQRLSPVEVRNARFATTRLREGYDLGEVDDFLDRIEAELTRRERLAGG